MSRTLDTVRVLDTKTPEKSKVSSKDAEQQLAKEMMLAIQANPKLAAIQTLASRAVKATISRLESKEYGSKVGAQHRQALLAVHTGIASQAYQLTKEEAKGFPFPQLTDYTVGRLPYDLFCGGGKTQSIVSIIQAIHELGIEDISLCIASSQIEASCKIIKQLVELGVPAEKLGLYYSKSTKNTYSLEPTSLKDISTKQFAFITHQRIHIHDKYREDQWLNTFFTFNGVKRSLMIYDEVLIPCDAWFTTSSDINIARKRLEAEKDNKGNLEGIEALAYNYLEECWQRFEKCLEAADFNKKAPIIQLPQANESEVEQLRQYAKKLKSKSFECFDILNRLADLTNYQVSVNPLQTDPSKLKVDKKTGKITSKIAIMTYHVTVPDYLDNIAILDASHTLQSTLVLRSDIKLHPLFEQNDFLSAKNHQDVVVNWVNGYSGRTHIEGLIERESKKKSLRDYWLEVVKSIPVDESFTTVTFKEKTGKNLNIINELKDDMRASKIDPSTLLKDGSPKYRWLTYGNHVSQNGFSDCPNAFLFGVLHRNQDELVATTIVQSEGEKHTIKGYTTAQQLVQSEAMQVIHQAINRFQCRRINNGRALPTNVWLQHKLKDNDEVLRRIMPGIQIKVVDYGESKAESQKGIAEQIVKVVREQLETQTNITTNQVKKLMGLTNQTKSEKQKFTRASHDAATVLEAEGIIKRRQSFERIEQPSTAADYFTDTVDGYQSREDEDN